MKRVLITGVNTGIGFGLAKELLKKGFEVICCCRKKDYFSFLHAEFSRISKKFHMYAFDMEKDFLPVLERIREECGVPHIIINNSAVYHAGSNDMLSDWEDVEKSMKVNVKAPALICDFFAPAMQNLDWGRIVNISSKMGSLGDNSSGGCFPYRCSKAALNMYTLNLAHRMQDSNIKVFCVHPGWIKTRMGGMSALDEVEKAVERILFTLTDEAEELHGRFLFGSETLPW
jgi:NAD(P)-dependent dehydrogenase (short-subunit alcohol dehydrogenase family)